VRRKGKKKAKRRGVLAILGRKIGSCWKVDKNRVFVVVFFPVEMSKSGHVFGLLGTSGRKVASWEV
jgi:hypothetical protein